MLALKIVAIVLTAVAGLLTAGLEYRWHDKRTRSHKVVRRLLFCVLVISGLAAVALVIYGDREMTDQISTLNDLKNAAETAERESSRREETAQRDRDQVKQQLASLQAAVRPIVAVASARYPQLESAAALSRLADEVQSLQQKSQTLDKRTRELAARDTFRPLSAPIRDAVTQQVIAVAEAASGRPITLQVWVEASHTGRQRIASELVDILKSAGVTVIGPTPMMTFARGTLPAAKFGLNSADEDISNALATALNPFLRVKFIGERKNDLEPGHLSIYLYGEPAFAEDGSVSFP